MVVRAVLISAAGVALSSGAVAAIIGVAQLL